jgi:hypothetical protein
LRRKFGGRHTDTVNRNVFLRFRLWGTDLQESHASLFARACVRSPSSQTRSANLPAARFVPAVPLQRPAARMRCLPLNSKRTGWSHSPGSKNPRSKIFFTASERQWSDNAQAPNAQAPIRTAQAVSFGDSGTHNSVLVGSGANSPEWSKVLSLIILRRSLSPLGLPAIRNQRDRAHKET